MGSARAALLELVQPPRVAMFCGNIFVGAPELEAKLASEMAAIIAPDGTSVFVTRPDDDWRSDFLPTGAAAGPGAGRPGWG